MRNAMLLHAERILDDVRPYTDTDTAADLARAQVYALVAIARELELLRADLRRARAEQT